MEAISISRYWRAHLLASLLLALPAAYFVIAYIYLAWWHNQVFLWNTLVHENGRLTLAGTIFYFDHFLGAAPMIIVFALCATGGLALAGAPLPPADPSRAANVAAVLLGAAGSLVLIAFAASVLTAGWERTLDYALQKIERDGVLSKGGNWNQFQLSNIPIALGAIGVGSSLVILAGGFQSKRNASLSRRGKMCIALAAALATGLTAVTFPGWQAFLNPRWMAHSIREMATHPLTSVPIALASMLLVEHRISKADAWQIKPRLLSLILIGAGILMLFSQLSYLSGVDVMAMAQKPAFAAGGISIPYLLASHVFEHFLDFVFIAPLTGGIYALIRRQQRGA